MCIKKTSYGNYEETIVQSQRTQDSPLNTGNRKIHQHGKDVKNVSKINMAQRKVISLT